LVHQNEVCHKLGKMHFTCLQSLKLLEFTSFLPHKKAKRKKRSPQWIWISSLMLALFLN